MGSENGFFFGEGEVGFGVEEVAVRSCLGGVETGEEFVEVVEGRDWYHCRTAFGFFG